MKGCWLLQCFDRASSGNAHLQGEPQPCHLAALWQAGGKAAPSAHPHPASALDGHSATAFAQHTWEELDLEGCIKRGHLATEALMMTAFSSEQGISTTKFAIGLKVG